MKILQAATFLVCLAILILLIYSQPKENANSFWSNLKPSAKVYKAVLSQEIDFSTSTAIMERLRDTLSDGYGAGYSKLHTGGVRFQFEDIKAYMATIYNKAKRRGLSEDSIRNLSIYICPGMYPDGYSNAEGTDVSKKMTCFLFVPLKGEGIFDTGGRRLNIPQNQFLSAYNWGSLEP